jgi:methyl-accepting chemotaxis protein
MIDKLQSATKLSVVSMGKSSTQANESEEYSHGTFELLNSMDDSITRVFDMTNQIATASEEQVAVVEDVNRNAVRINELCNLSMSRADQTSSAAERVKSMAANILELVKQYKI